MLRQAMMAAEKDPLQSGRAFEEVLGRYRAHPGVLRGKREAETSRKQQHERAGRACYWSERKRIPKAVTHRMASLEELVVVPELWSYG